MSSWWKYTAPTDVTMESKCNMDSLSDFVNNDECNLNSRSSCRNKLLCLRRRAVLKAESACAIYRMRSHSTPLTPGEPLRTLSGRSVLVAHMFGVSPKAVRDIWNRRTWRHVTEAIWFTAGERGCCAVADRKSEGFGDMGCCAVAAAATAGGREETACHGLAVQLPNAARTARPRGRPRGSKDSHPRRRTSAVRRADVPQGPTYIALPPPPLPLPPLPPPPSSLDSAGCAGILLPSKRTDWACSARSRPPSPPAPPPEDDPELRRCFPFFLRDPPAWP